VDAGIVELDALADAVGAGAENNHALLFGLAGFIEVGVAGVEVGGGGLELAGAGIDQTVDRDDAQLLAMHTDLVAGAAAQHADLLVGETVLLGVFQQGVV